MKNRNLPWTLLALAALGACRSAEPEAAPEPAPPVPAPVVAEPTPAPEPAPEPVAQLPEIRYFMIADT